MRPSGEPRFICEGVRWGLWHPARRATMGPGGRPCRYQRLVTRPTSGARVPPRPRRGRRLETRGMPRRSLVAAIRRSASCSHRRKQRDLVAAFIDEVAERSGMTPAAPSLHARQCHPRGGRRPHLRRAHRRRRTLRPIPRTSQRRHDRRLTAISKAESRQSPADAGHAPEWGASGRSCGAFALVADFAPWVTIAR